MAFDQATRNRLQKFVSESRNLLTEEFTRQLQSEFGMDPNTGDVAKTESLTHLNNHGRETAKILREMQIHYGTSLSAKSEKEKSKQTILRIIREQAFTVLNRLCALRMAEARGFSLESVSKGFQSQGFQLYKNIAGMALGGTGDAYRQFVFSLFDEFSTELAVLFDRNNSQGRLFPREATLLALLDQINHFEIEPLWAEDETIGWIYQYFNSQEERKKMRAESQAPRNSRELAIRNQFFTPRYVVEFLTDNTLGRIWFEMTQGKTTLADTCRYLVKRPKEVFLKQGETAPEPDKDESTLTQEALLQQTVYIPYREFKDPRSIRMLDPACGSMHFGLYAFDLFERIYVESWEWQKSGERGQKTEGYRLLIEDYPTQEELLRAIPKLIIEHNIHGVDIDPRAVQIAGLSLWLRAQRSWHEQKTKPQDRPTIQRSHIVCAEPMPGSKDMLREFTSKLNPPLLGQLVETIFEKMELAGEAGTLLKIEEEIASTINHAKDEFNKELLRRKNDEGYLSGFAPERPMGLFDFAELLDDTQFWDTAEENILQTLRNYSEQTESQAGQKRLFAEDTARGFAFIDLCRKRFDVVLMNPPFGEFTDLTKEYAKTAFSNSSFEIDAAFVARGTQFLFEFGKTGVIANRTQLFKGLLEQWRVINFKNNSKIDTLVDLGYGVLDGAVVEATAFVLSHDDSEHALSLFIRALDTDNKAERILTSINVTPKSSFNIHEVFLQKFDFFNSLPAKRLAYWISRPFADAFIDLISLEGNYGYARQGLASADNFRFVRLVWEVSPSHQFAIRRGVDIIARWYNFAKGGEYSPYFQDLHLVINFENGGKELSTFPGSVIRNPSFYLKPALTYSERTASGFSPRALPAGCLFDSKGPIVASSEKVSNSGLLSFLMSRPAASFLEFLVAAGDSAVSGTAARQYTQSIVGAIPIPNFEQNELKLLEENANKVWTVKAQVDSYEETGRLFLCCPVAFGPILNGFVSIKDTVVNHFELLDSLDLQILEATWHTEQIVRDSYKFDFATREMLDREFGNHPLSFAEFSVVPDEFGRLFLMECDQVITELIERVGGGRSITKKCYFVNRKTELLSQYFGINIKSLYIQRQQQKLIPSSKFVEETKRFVSYIIGIIFGRWNVQFAIEGSQPPIVSDPFLPLPVSPPGMLQTNKGLPAEQKDISADYPVQIFWSGILVDDENHPNNIDVQVRNGIQTIWKDRSEAIEQEACEILNVNSIREYIRRPSFFFADHLNHYSKSRRQAPIYWPLQTPSCSYTLWVYYHRLTDQTLYTCVNEFVEPKLRQVEDTMRTLRSKNSRTNAEEREYAQLTALELELKDFRAELLRIAQFWKPNLNDGVQITAAPLWKLFQHKAWQKKLKETWQKMEEGEYDWAHLSYTIWPERVLRKCQTDRSLAIAHDVEEVFWEEVPVEKKTKKASAKKAKKKVELDEGEEGDEEEIAVEEPKTVWKPKVMTESQVNELIRELVERGRG